MFVGSWEKAEWSEVLRRRRAKPGLLRMTGFLDKVLRTERRFEPIPSPRQRFFDKPEMTIKVYSRRL
jgi:hypothetical protein